GTEVLAYKAALASRAVALFGETSGTSVRAVATDGYSSELCGGTHVRSTAEIGLFMIVSESSVGSAIRRIEALTGRAAVGRAQAIEAALREAAGVLRVPAEEVPDRLRQLAGRTRALEAEVVSARVREAAPDLDAAVRAAP